MSEQIWLALYQLSRHLLTAIPSFDTLEGKERQEAVEIKAALVCFVKVTERKFGLPSTYHTKAERRHRQLA